MVVLDADRLTPERAAELARIMGQLTGAPVPAAHIEAAARHHHLFVALDRQGRAMGMACLVVMHLPQGIRLLVESMVVDECYRGSGIGRALLDAVVIKAEGYGTGEVRLTCRAGRVAALALYQAAGFTLAGTDVYQRSLI